MGSDKVAEPLGSNNYATWSIQMQAMLLKKRLWAVTDPTAPEIGPHPDPNDAEKAFGIIVENVEKQHLQAVWNCRTARVAWSMLQNQYRSQILAREVQLQAELCNLKKRDGEDVSQYVSRARTIFTDLKSMDPTLSDRQLVRHILAGLPSKFNVIKQILTASAVELTIDAMVPKLLQAEQDVGASSSNNNDDTAAYAARGSFRGSFRGRGRGGGRFGNVKCFNCGRMGHISRDCRQQQEGHGAGGSGGSSGAPSMAMTVTEQASVSHMKDGWLMDSGAMRHITSDRARFTEYTQLVEMYPVSSIMIDMFVNDQLTCTICLLFGSLLD